jgi:hypothetical protein
MDVQKQPIEDLRDIRKYMDQSSRFISLSGWSGISAGTCALIAAFYTATRIECWKRGDCPFDRMIAEGGPNLQGTLVKIAIVTFCAAFVLAFLFTWLRSRKTGVPIWGYTARKVMIHLTVPIAVGGLFLWRMMELGEYALLAPGCLIFYGLGLVSAGKYTLSEIRYMGYLQLLLGVINLYMIGYGLYFWAAGFGLVHIIYGIIMWNKYERNS